MTNNDLFAKLAEKFDSGQIVGAPMAPSLLKWNTPATKDYCVRPFSTFLPTRSGITAMEAKSDSVWKARTQR